MGEKLRLRGEPSAPYSTKATVSRLMATVTPHRTKSSQQRAATTWLFSSSCLNTLEFLHIHKFQRIAVSAALWTFNFSWLSAVVSFHKSSTIVELGEGGGKPKLVGCSPFDGNLIISGSIIDRILTVQTSVSVQYWPQMTNVRVCCQTIRFCRWCREVDEEPSRRGRI